MKHDWLEDMGVTEEDAMRLVRELLERSPRVKKGISRLNYCRKIIAEGCREIEESTCTVTLKKAMEVSLNERGDRRPVTLKELKWVMFQLTPP